MFAVALIVFWITVYIVSRVVSVKKYGFQVEPAYIIYRSSKFKRFLETISENRASLWKTFSNLSVAVGVGLMVFAVYFLSDNVLRLIKPGLGGASLLPILPGITIRFYWVPYLILAVTFGFLIHEAAHGIVARIEDIPLESAGLIFFVVFPGGFVEPDEKRFEGASLVSKLRVVSAGSFANFAAYLLVMLLLSVFFVNTPSGLVLTGVQEDGLIYEAGLDRWDVIYSVNGTLQNLSSFINNLTPGDKLVLDTSKGEINITLQDGTGWQAIGVVPPLLIYYPSRLNLGPFLDVQLYLLLLWGNIIYSSLAIFNMLPVYPFDGDKFLYYISKRFTRRDKEVRILFNVAFLGLMAANMALSFIKHGLFLI